MVVDCPVLNEKLADDGVSPAEQLMMTNGNDGLKPAGAPVKLFVICTSRTLRVTALVKAKAGVLAPTVCVTGAGMALQLNAIDESVGKGANSVTVHEAPSTTLVTLTGVPAATANDAAVPLAGVGVRPLLAEHAIEKLKLLVYVGDAGGVAGSVTALVIEIVRRLISPKSYPTAA